MALVLKDRVKETSITTGTGTLTLAGASTGYQSFSAIGNGNTTYYAVTDPVTGDWEVGIGTYTSVGTTLSRDTVLSSSNAGSLVSFAAGIKDVFATYPSERAVWLDASSNVSSLGTVASGTWNGTTVGLGYGGTGATTAQAAMNTLAGAVTSGSYLRGNGTNVAMSTIQAADVPTLNQNTTGSAATLTTGRTLAITGDLAYTSPSFNGSANVTAAGTLATVNANVGAFTNASLTVNAKGLVTAASSGTAPVTSVTGTAPVVSSGGTTPAISMAAATTSVSGYLTSTDWNTFNNKTSNTGTVTSVSATVPTGLSIAGSPITTSGTLAITYTAGYAIPTTASQTNWDTAYTDRLKWDGGSTGLVAATGRTSLGGTTVGQNMFTLTNPTAITFPRFNADNTVSALDAATFRTAIGAGTSSTTGTVTSVATAGTVSGLTLTGGPITTTGTITLGGTLAVTASNFASQVANTFLAAPTGVAGVPTFRAMVAADVPTLNQNTTGSAATLTTGRTLAVTGDLAWTSPSFNGSANVTAAGTLATVNANVGSFTNATLTVNAKGLITAASSGTAPVTSVTGTAPVVSSGGATPAISMAAATTAVSGYLTSTDWNTFNNKTSNTGTVTSVATAGTVSGLTLTGGPITTTGTITLGGTLAVTASNFASQTANTFLAAPTGIAGVPTFRAVVAADIPTLNQNTTGSAATLTTGRTIGMTGDVTWTSGSFNGSANVTGTATLATVTAVKGGTGQTTYAVGDLLVGGATNTLTKLADVATGNALISGGVGVAPSYGKIGLTTHISGTLAVGNGGTGVATLTGLAYGNGTSAFTAATAAQVVAVINSTAVTNATNAANVTATTSATASAFKVPFLNTTVSTTGNYGLLQDSTATFTYNPSTNTVESGVVAASSGFFINSKTIAASYSIPAGYSASSTGPLTLSAGVAVTVPSGSRWVVL